MSEIVRPRNGRVPGWVAAIPLVLGALCLLAILPLLLYAPDNASAAFVSGKAFATIALVAYPILLVSLMTVGVWAKQQGRLAIGPLRLVFWCLQGTFVAVLVAGAVLMWSP